MKNENIIEIKKEARKKLESLLDEIDKINLNTEVIENYNNLITDKLEEATRLEESIDTLNKPIEEIILNARELTRYSNSYTLLNYTIKDKTLEIEESNNKISKLFKEIIALIDRIDNTEEDGGLK